MSSATDTFIAYKFIKILTRDWDEMPAFEFGIIDKKGKSLKKFRDLKTQEERNSYTVFHRLIFNIKRLLEKLPFGRSKLASFSLALILLREGPSGPQDKRLEKFLSENFEDDELDMMFEDYAYNELLLEATLDKGEYELIDDILVGEKIVGKKKDIIIVKKKEKADQVILGEPVFKVFHKKSKQNIFIQRTDIKKVK